MLLWVLGALLVAAGIGYFSLQSAITRNGPAVVNAIDRLAGGSRDVERVMPIAYGSHPQQRLFVQRQRTAAADRKPVLVFIHGGSWNSGDPADYGFIGRNFAPQGFVVVEAGYRLGEEGRFPAMVEDSAVAVAWVYRNIARFGGDPARIWLMGHSAGAYNAVQITLDRRWLDAASVPANVPAGAIGLSGPYDFLPLDTDASRAAFGNFEDLPATQPVNFVRPDAPPMLLLTGDKDTTVKPRHTVALAKRLREAGAVVESGSYPGMDHADPLLALARPWRGRSDIFERIERFIAAHEEVGGKASLAVQAQRR